MRVRYKKTGTEANSSRFNPSGLGEVLTEDDSPLVTELDAWLENKRAWKDMFQAFKDNDLSISFDNLSFCENTNAEQLADRLFGSSQDEIDRRNRAKQLTKDLFGE